MTKNIVILTALLGMLFAGCSSHKPKPHATVESAPPPPSHEEAAYSKPLSTPGYRFSSLPQAVRNTVVAQAGMAVVVDVVKEAHEGRLVYKIYFKDAGNYPPLWVAADGSVLNHDYTTAVPAPVPSVALDPSDLPPDVAKFVHEHAPDGEITSVLRETWTAQTVYTVSFKYESHNPKLYIVSDGTNLTLGR